MALNQWPTADDAELKLAQRVGAHITGLMQRHAQGLVRSNRLTIGVEIEFFLETASGGLPDYAQAAEFFQVLGSFPGWSRSVDAAHNELLVNAASRELPGKRYTKVKFEYPPHMLEIAFAFFDDLNALSEEIKQTMDGVMLAASRVGLVGRFTPFQDKVLKSKTPELTVKIRKLNLARRNYLESFGSKPAETLVMFPSYMAGSQIHVGGLQWWDDEQYIRDLYYMESCVPLYGASLTAGGDGDAAAIYGRRTQLYQQCFPHFRLTTFPSIPQWSMDNWVRELVASPLGNGVPEEVLGRPYRDVVTSPVLTLEQAVHAFRDLQYVRPGCSGLWSFEPIPLCPPRRP